MNSKQKGSAFERKVCKALSLWVTHGEKPDCFWRSAMSGGRATTHLKQGIKIRQSGDITAVSPEGHKLTDDWFIECKHVKSLDLIGFLLNNTGHLAQFWRVAIAQARAHNKHPMLIAKQNHLPTVVIVDNLVQLQTTVRPRVVSTYWGNSLYLFEELFVVKQPRRHHQ